MHPDDKRNGQFAPVEKRLGLTAKLIERQGAEHRTQLFPDELFANLFLNEPYASEWGGRTLIRGGQDRLGQVHRRHGGAPLPVWSLGGSRGGSVLKFRPAGQHLDHPLVHAVRVAALDDAVAVAGIHVRSWQRTLLIPGCLLSTSGLERRADIWSRILTDTHLPRTGAIVVLNGLSSNTGCLR